MRTDTETKPFSPNDLRVDFAKLNTVDEVVEYIQILYTHYEQVGEVRRRMLIQGLVYVGLMIPVLAYSGWFLYLDYPPINWVGIFMWGGLGLFSILRIADLVQAYRMRANEMRSIGKRVEALREVIPVLRTTKKWSSQQYAPIRQELIKFPIFER